MSVINYYSFHLQLRLELYGPSGLRKLIRTNLQITQLALRGKYAAHELLFENETSSASCEEDALHENEIPGRDIRAGEDGLWRGFEQSDGFEIHAAPLVHRGKLVVRLVWLQYLTISMT